jgi:methylated-DNA-[protein]-cysteine S-methyltransferase
MNQALTWSLEQQIRSGQLLSGMTFNQKVWALTARIPKGRVTTYAELARALGSKAYRAVGNAMNRNPYAPGVPCHRVVGSDGSLTGYAHGLEKKRRMLTEEGIEVANSRVDVEDLFRFDDAMTNSSPSGKTSPLCHQNR